MRRVASRFRAQHHPSHSHRRANAIRRGGDPKEPIKCYKRMRLDAPLRRVRSVMAANTTYGKTSRLHDITHLQPKVQLQGFKPKALPFQISLFLEALRKAKRSTKRRPVSVSPSLTGGARRKKKPPKVSKFEKKNLGTRCPRGPVKRISQRLVVKATSLSSCKKTLRTRSPDEERKKKEEVLGRRKTHIYRQPRLGFLVPTHRGRCYGNVPVLQKEGAAGWAEGCG